MIYPVKRSKIKTMGYEIALKNAWNKLTQISAERKFSVKLLADEYSVDLDNHSVLSLSCNVPAKDYAAILILHYLVAKAKGLPRIKDEWLTFRELAGVEGYEQAFRQRVVERIIKKYGKHPEGLLSVLERLPGKKIMQADVAVVLDVFAGVPALIEMWKADDEFGAEANLLFDASIKEIYCIEDSVVLAEFIVSQL